MKMKLLGIAAFAAFSIGVSAPAAAAPAPVQRAMASYAAEVAGADAEGRAKVKAARHAAHVAADRGKAGRNCGECCTQLGRCEDCAAEEAAHCADGDCGDAKGAAKAKTAATVSA